MSLTIFTLVRLASASASDECDRAMSVGGRRHAVEAIERFDESRWAWFLGEDTELTLDDEFTGQVLHVYGAPDFALGIPGMRLTESPPEPVPPPTFVSTMLGLVRGVFDLSRYGAAGGKDQLPMDEGAVHLHFADAWSAFPLYVRRAPGRFGAEPSPQAIVGTSFVTAFGEARRKNGPLDPSGHPWRAEAWAVPRPNRPGPWTTDDTRALASLHRRLRRLAPGVPLTVHSVVRATGLSRGPLYFVARVSSD